MTRVLRKIGPSGNFLKPRKWDDWAVEDFVAGTYAGKTSQTDKYGNAMYLVVIDKTVKDHDAGECPVESSVEGEDGITYKNVVVLYKNGGLDHNIKEIPVGEFVKVTYKGMTTTGNKSKFKGKPCHNVEVESDYVPDEDVSGGDSMDDDFLGGH